MPGGAFRPTLAKNHDPRFPAAVRRDPRCPAAVGSNSFCILKQRMLMHWLLAVQRRRAWQAHGYKSAELPGTASV